MTWFRSHRREPAAISSRTVGLICLLGLLVAGSATAQVGGRGASKFYPDSSEAAETLLRNAASHAQNGQWAEAIGIYQRVIDQYGEKVARLPRDPTDPAGNEEFVLFVDLRAYCQRILAGLPPEARALYRNRVDPQAERWYRQGRAERDPTPLRLVVERAFCSSWGDDALELLGDLAFQDGRFAEALALYRRLVPDDPDDKATFVHPDPSVDLARVAAKKLLCRAAAGAEVAVPGEDLDAFARRFPGAEGNLTGRKGPIVEILTEALKADRLAPPDQGDERWPTFAGAPSRTHVPADSVDVGSLQWRAPLERINPARPVPPYGLRPAPPNASATSAQLLGYHPIVVGDQVIVCDGRRVLAYNLSDRADDDGGRLLAVEPAWRYDPEGDGAIPQARQATWVLPRFTLTAVGDRIYARMGVATPPVFMGINRGGGEGTSIIALDRSKSGDKRLWTKRASELTLPDRPAQDRVGRSVNFEGTPVADEQSVYAAITDRREQTATYVAGFDAADGSLRWIRYLGAAASENDPFLGMGGMGFGGLGAADPGHRLLSLEGSVLYYQTNLGALAALDAETGEILWVATYPRREMARGGDATERDLNPAVVHDGLVFIAPSDADAIFAFEAQTGRLRWKTDSIPDEVKITHLLGVAKGRLVATGDRVLLFDVRDGKLLRAWPDSGTREGFGRGLLAGDRIYWPTRNEIEVLNQLDGGRAAPPIRLAETFRTTGGNLVAGDGYLIVAQSDALVVFCQNSRLIERYRDEIAAFPERAPAHYRLARAAEAIGEDDLALESYENALQRARPTETIDGSPLADAARDHLFGLLTRTAAKLRTENNPAAAAERLEAAARAARSDQERLRARLLLAETRLEMDRAEEAIDVLQRLLADQGIERLSVASDDGRRSVRADLFLADRLAAIVRERGREVYREYDRRARELLERGRRDRDPRALADAARLQPAAEVVPEALLTLGALYEADDRQAEATVVYKRLLALAAIDDQTRARALWRLARAYEERGYLVSARDALLQLRTRYPEARIEAEEGTAPAAELAAAALGRSALADLAADRPRPPTPSPLVRRWTWRGPDGEDSARPLAAFGTPPAVDLSRAFLVDNASVTSLDPATGAPLWTAELGERALWVGYLADKLVAATPRRVVALDPRTGEARWRFGREDDPGPKRGPDPFARGDPPADARGGLGAPLSGFQVVGDRLFLLRGDDELIAVDAADGIIQWSYSVRGGTIDPKVWIGPDRLVLRTDGPSELVALETETGLPVSRLALAPGEGLERTPVPLDDNHVIVVTDRRGVKSFDMAQGRFAWEYRESQEMPVNGAPRPLVDAERLLVVHDGRTLIRLDPATGAKRWSTVLGTENLGERPNSLALDEERFYCVSKQTIRAISLEDGSPLWSRHLAGPDLLQWALALSDRAVLAYPSSSSVWEDQTESLPIVARRRTDGDLIQRFALPATIADARLRLDARGGLLATSRELWALGALAPTRSAEAPASP